MRFEHPDIVRLLRAYGAKLTTSDRQGRTPLHLAALSHNTEVMEALLTPKLDLPPTQSTEPLLGVPRESGAGAEVAAFPPDLGPSPLVDTAGSVQDAILIQPAVGLRLKIVFT